MKNLKKSLLSAFIAAAMAITFTACGTTNGGEPEQTTGAPETTALPDAMEETIAVTDRGGNKHDVPENLTRIVSASPSNTEILIGLGLKDKIIATDMYSADTGIDPAIATIDMMNINLEEIIALSPEVVVLNGMSMVGAEDPYKAIKDAGIEVLYIPEATSINDIKEDIKFLAAYTKTTDKGNEMIASIDEAVASAKSIGETVTEKKKVYFEVSEAPYCYSCGSGTYVNEIIELIGAENIFADQSGWLAATEESIIAANPDVILTTVSYDGYDYNEIFARAGWDSTNAVKNGAVFTVNGNATSRASQNIVDGINAIAKAVYPEAFKD